MEEWIIDREDPETVLDFICASCGSSDRKKVICVDYFDTVVTRNIIPEHTKGMASAALSQLLNGVLSGPQLYQMRKELELEMTRRNAEKTGELDFCLTDFARQFHLLLVGLVPQSMLWGLEEFIDLLLNIEVAVEKTVQMVCPQMYRLLQALRERGFDLVLVSDFYLPEKCFSEILRSLRLESFFSHLYVSSSRGKGKGSGRIYPQIAEDLQCSTDQMMMIGDNLHADIAMARKHKMQTLHVIRSAAAALSNPGNASGCDAKTFPAGFFSKLPDEGHFSEMASSLWLFTHRLFNELRQEQAAEVFFLSKEGEFLKSLFDSYQTQLFGKELIRSHYLLASRKATFLASLRPLAEEDFLRLFAHYRDISISDFLQSLNLESEVIDALCLQLDFDCAERFFDLRNRQEFSQLVALPLFRQEYERRRGEQRKNFREYLDSYKVDLSNKPMYLVDVGWKGSIQDNIFYILNSEIEVQGYFIGSYHATELSERNRKKGLLFDNFQGMSPFYTVYNNNRSLYEMMLGATHGSADCYLTSQQYDKENTHAHLAVHTRIEREAGDLYVLVLDLPEERALFEKAIRPLQDNLLHQFICICKGYLRADCIAPDPEWFARRHARMVFTPRKEEIEFFTNLYHLENFGIFEYTNFQTAAHPTLRQRCRNLKNILRNPALLETGIWPPIILQRLGLGWLQRFDGKRRFSREFGRRGKLR